MAGGVVGYLAAGGPIVFVLLALSLVSLTLIVLKVLQLRQVRSGGARRRQALEQWRRGERAAALRTLQGGSAPADRVAAYAVEGLAAGVDRRTLDAEIERRGNEELERMNRHLRVLEVIAVVGPLLGLLGTVLGMIQSFQELELAQGSANAAVLAGGIWQALLTTAAGLIVAIPAAVAAQLIAARVESAGHLIENTVGQLYLIEDTRREAG
jgi:biopolymer transport protein ExbB